MERRDNADDFKELAEQLYPKRLIIIGDHRAGCSIPVYMRNNSFLFRAGTGVTINPEDYIIPWPPINDLISLWLILPKKRARWRIKKRRI